MRTYVLLLLLSAASSCIGQVQTYYVRPIQTDAAYAPTEDSSAVSRNTAFQLNKLFLFIGGTGSSSSTDYNALRLHAADLGFDVINLSYPNTVAAASLTNSSDSMAFNKYRQELCFGTPVSDAVEVDSLNSIYTRTLKLIQYLALTYPEQNWGQYLAAPNSLNWSNVIVGGHSQGSGHACYLAKQYAVERVLMFSGPNDFSNAFSNSANWIRQAGVTAVNRHYVYDSLNDEAVPYSEQFTVIAGLGMLLNDDTTHVDDISVPYGNSHCLYTTQAPGIVLLNHNVPVKISAINSSVWTYMLTSEITTGLPQDLEQTIIRAYPNPARDLIQLSAEALKDGSTYSIHDLAGQLVKSGMLVPHGAKCEIDISDLPSGPYVLSVNIAATKIIKQ